MTEAVAGVHPGVLQPADALTIAEWPRPMLRRRSIAPPAQSIESSLGILMDLPGAGDIFTRRLQPAGEFTMPVRIPARLLKPV